MESSCEKTAMCLFKDVPPDEARKIIMEIADEGGKRGARAVMKELGLIGEDKDSVKIAANDLKDLRALLSDWRHITTGTKGAIVSVCSKVWDGVLRVLGFLILGWIVLKIGGNTENLRKLGL